MFFHHAATAAPKSFHAKNKFTITLINSERLIYARVQVCLYLALPQVGLFSD